MLSLENYFKDIIDWKTYNYLVDKSTKYEVLDFVVNIECVVRGDVGEVNRDFFIFKSVNGKLEYNYITHGSTLTHYRKLIEKNGLSFLIEIHINIPAYKKRISNSDLVLEFFEMIRKNIKKDYKIKMLYSNSAILLSKKNI